MTVIRWTGLRLHGLRYAAGRDHCFPAAAVMRPLQRAGLVEWRGDVYAGFHRIVTAGPESRGWYLTAEGDRVLAEWESELAAR